MTDDEYVPRYKWRETWAGEGHQDFTAWDGEHYFARIQLDQTTHNYAGKWKWNIIHIPWVRRHLMPASGWEETAREASRAAEDQYERIKAAHGR